MIRDRLYELKGPKFQFEDNIEIDVDTDQQSDELYKILNKVI